MKTKHIKNIIFDLGGVLIDWNPRYLYNRLLNHDHQKIDFFLTKICTQEWNEENIFSLN
jgi:2-haloacid dehalogenase